MVYMLSAQNAVRCWDVRDARLLVLIAFMRENDDSHV